MNIYRLQRKKIQYSINILYLDYENYMYIFKYMENFGFSKVKPTMRY